MDAEQRSDSLLCTRGRRDAIQKDNLIIGWRWRSQNIVRIPRRSQSDFNSTRPQNVATGCNFIRPVCSSLRLRCCCFLFCSVLQKRRLKTDRIMQLGEIDVKYLNEACGTDQRRLKLNIKAVKCVKVPRELDVDPLPSV